MLACEMSIAMYVVVVVVVVFIRCCMNDPFRTLDGVTAD